MFLIGLITIFKRLGVCAFFKCQEWHFSTCFTGPSPHKSWKPLNIHWSTAWSLGLRWNLNRNLKQTDRILTLLSLLLAESKLFHTFPHCVFCVTEHKSVSQHPSKGWAFLIRSGTAFVWWHDASKHLIECNPFLEPLAFRVYSSFRHYHEVRVTKWISRRCNGLWPFSSGHQLITANGSSTSYCKMVNYEESNMNSKTETYRHCCWSITSCPRRSRLEFSSKMLPSPESLNFPRGTASIARYHHGLCFWSGLSPGCKT